MSQKELSELGGDNIFENNSNPASRNNSDSSDSLKRMAVTTPLLPSLPTSLSIPRAHTRDQLERVKTLKGILNRQAFTSQEKVRIPSKHASRPEGCFFDDWVERNPLHSRSSSLLGQSLPTNASSPNNSVSTAIITPLSFHSLHGNAVMTNSMLPTKFRKLLSNVPVGNGKMQVLTESLSGYNK
jgi:hypothetical protein